MKVTFIDKSKGILRKWKRGFAGSVLTVHFCNGKRAVQVPHLRETLKPCGAKLGTLFGRLFLFFTILLHYGKKRNQNTRLLKERVACFLLLAVNDSKVLESPAKGHQDDQGTGSTSPLRRGRDCWARLAWRRGGSGGILLVYINTWMDGAKSIESHCVFSGAQCQVKRQQAQTETWGSVWASGNAFALCGWWSPGTGCPERLWSLPLWRSSRADLTWSWATCSGWPCLSGGVDQAISRGHFQP